MTTVQNVWLATFIVMVLTWLGLIVWVFERLRTRHRSTYEELGSPTLFWNNSLANNFKFMGFLYSSKIHTLGDPALARVCIVMRVLFPTYIASFLAFAIAT
jgi:hypothetical protein